MKKMYQKPAMQVVDMEMTTIICGSEKVTSVHDNAGLGWVGGSDEEARAKGRGIWDD